MPDALSPRPPLRSAAGGALLRALIVLGLLVAVGATVLDAIYRVSPDEVAVVSRLGRRPRVIQQPGLHFKLPFIEEVRRLGPSSDPSPETHTQQREERYLSYTKAVLRLSYVATWKVVDPARYALTVAGDARRTEARVADIAQSLLRTVLARLTPDQALAQLPGTADLATPNPLGGDLLQKMNPLLRELGIEIVQWRVEQAAAPGS